MLWSHSNRETHRMCPAWWNAQYRERSVKRRQTAEAARGDVTHQMIEGLVHWRMGLGRPATRQEIVDWCGAQVDDLTEENGLVTSAKLDAAWIIETALPLFKPVFAALDTADSWGTEADWYYDAQWERWTGSIEDFYRYARENDAYGGIPDLWAVTGKRLWIWDWKTGKRYPKWEQLRDYALYGALSFPGVDRVTGTFVWLTQGLADADTWDRADLTNHHRTSLLTEVSSLRGATSFPTSPGFPQCSWCPVEGCSDRKEKKR